MSGIYAQNMKLKKKDEMRAPITLVVTDMGSRGLRYMAKGIGSDGTKMATVMGKANFEAAKAKGYKVEHKKADPKKKASKKRKSKKSKK